MSYMIAEKAPYGGNKIDHSMAPLKALETDGEGSAVTTRGER